MKNHLRQCIAAAILLTGAAPAFAEEVIEEIVVTATKRAATIQDVPFSINAQTEADLRRSGAQTIEDISRNVAGLTVQNLGPGQSQVAIRGVSAGQIVRDQPGVKEQVGVYLDETLISLSLFTPDLDLFDLNRVETLRGPQGTLYGSGSVGGTIRYITNQPVDEFEALLEASANTVTDGHRGGHFKAMVNLPLGDLAALRAAVYNTEYAGFIDARLEGGGLARDINGGSRKGARVALAIQATDNIRITPRIITQEIEADGFNRQEVFNLFANPFTTSRPAVSLGEREQHLLLGEEFEDETLILDVTVEVELDGMDLTFVQSKVDRDIFVGRDASALTGSVSVDLGFGPDGILRPSNLLDTTSLDQTITEIRLSSSDDGPVQWLVGFFSSNAEREYAQRLPTPLYDVWTDAALGAGTAAAVANGYGADSPFNSDLPYDLEQTAFFGEATWSITDELAVTLGGRFYDYEEVRTISSGGLFSNGDSNRVDKTSSDGFTPRVLLSYSLSDDVTLNAQASQGFRLGGVNDPLNTGLCDPGDLVTFGAFQDYEDETLWNYEAGFKSRFDNGWTLNAAYFYSDIEDLQVTLDAGSCSSRISFNVEEAHTAGIEFELSGELAPALEVSFAGSFLQSEFDSTVRDSTGSILGGVQSGNRLASVPDVQLAATAEYSFPIDFGATTDAYVSGTIHYVGDRITQPSDQVPGAGRFASGLAYAGATGNEITAVDLELDAYTIVNLNFGVVYEDWDAVLFLHNAFDENANLSFDRERGGRARLAFRTNVPRTLGVTVRRSF